MSRQLPSPGNAVTDVLGTAPIISTGGTTPVISIADFVASGVGHARGAVPDPGAAAGTTKFLREDSSFAVPPGTGAPTSRNINTTAPLTGGGDLSSDRTLAISNFVGDFGAGGIRGAVPAPAAGDAAANKFLRASGGWGAVTSDPMPQLFMLMGA